MEQAKENVEGSSGPEQLGLFIAQRADLLRYISMIAADATLAEDIVQDVWVRFNAAAATQTIHEPRRFLFRIARNLALDDRRRRGLEQKLFTEDNGKALFVASDEPTVERSVEAASELILLQTALAKRPDRTRQAFLLHRVEGLTLVEIGARLGVSKSVAHELVTDAVDHCRAIYRRGT